MQQESYEPDREVLRELEGCSLFFSLNLMLQGLGMSLVEAHYDPYKWRGPNWWAVTLYASYRGELVKVGPVAYENRKGVELSVEEFEGKLKQAARNVKEGEEMVLEGAVPVYIDPVKGDDENDGMSPETPVATLSGAVSAMRRAGLGLQAASFERTVDWEDEE